MPLPCNQLSFPQKLGLPASLGRRKRSLLSLQIHKPLFQKHTVSAVRWKILLKSRTRVAARELLSRNWSQPHLPQNSPNCLAPGLSPRDRQLHKVTAFVPPHWQGGRRTNKSLWRKPAASVDCKPTSMLCSEGLTLPEQMLEPVGAEEVHPPRGRSAPRSSKPWTETAPLGNGKSFTVRNNKRRFLTERPLAAITQARASTRSMARRAEIRRCQCKHLPSLSNAWLCQGCPRFRGISVKLSTPREEGSHCHTYGLKETPFSSDTAASLGLNSDLLWCPLRYFPRL